MKLIVIAALFGLSLAQHDKIRKDFEKLQSQKYAIASSSGSSSYAGQCWKKSHLRIKAGVASMLQGNSSNVPGAGIDEFKPFETVLKDGFLPVSCVKDYMFYRGDKFGDNKHDYKLGPVSHVSIVHYDAFVEKKEPMTQKKCFEFCRTVPNMGFFGIVNGRGCYCTPYFKAMESDKSQCDAMCEGDKTIACGGKTKSSIFSMHMCDSTKEDLHKKMQSAEGLKHFMDVAVDISKRLSADMQGMGAELQKVFGAVGDSGAAGLMQKAKQFAGDLVHKAESVEAFSVLFGDLIDKGASLGGFQDPGAVTAAERVMEGLHESIVNGDDLAAKLKELEGFAVGNVEPIATHMKVLSGPTDDERSGPAPTVAGLDIVYAKAGHIIAGPNHMFGYLGAYDETPETFEECAHKVLEESTCQALFHYDKYDGECRCATGLPAELFEAYPGWSSYEVQRSSGGKVVPVPPLKQYYPVMYFVDKEFEDVPTTCSGDLVAKPIVDQSANTCAASCDANIHRCVGFQYFNDGGRSLCFLFSSFSTGFYYTGCTRGRQGHSSFLQTDGAAIEAKCYAKVSKFVGSTLKPDPSGKCKKCFKELTKANRCYY